MQMTPRQAAQEAADSTSSSSTSSSEAIGSRFRFRSRSRSRGHDDDVRSRSAGRPSGARCLPVHVPASGNAATKRR